MASNDITSIESVDGFSVSQDSPFYADIKQTVSPDGAVDGYTVKFNQGYIFNRTSESQVQNREERKIEGMSEERSLGLEHTVEYFVEVIVNKDNFLIDSALFTGVSGAALDTLGSEGGIKTDFPHIIFDQYDSDVGPFTGYFPIISLVDGSVTEFTQRSNIILSDRQFKQKGYSVYGDSAHVLKAENRKNESYPVEVRAIQAGSGITVQENDDYITIHRDTGEGSYPQWSGEDCQSSPAANDWTAYVVDSYKRGVTKAKFRGLDAGDGIQFDPAKANGIGSTCSVEIKTDLENCGSASWQAYKGVALGKEQFRGLNAGDRISFSADGSDCATTISCDLPDDYSTITLESYIIHKDDTDTKFGFPSANTIDFIAKDKPLLTLDGDDEEAILGEDGFTCIHVKSYGQVGSLGWDSSHYGRLYAAENNGTKVIDLNADPTASSFINGPFGVGTTTPTAGTSLDVIGPLKVEDSSIATDGSVQLGNSSTQTLQVKTVDSLPSFILGAGVKRLDSSYVDVGGSAVFKAFENSAATFSSVKPTIYGPSSPATGSAILGGSGNYISGNYNVIVAGAENSISGSSMNFIGGGSGLDIFKSEFSVSVGGKNNDILESDFSVIGGGFDNLVSGGGGRNVIGGGYDNEIHGASASNIAGGYQNIISGNYSSTAIAGGTQNKAYDTYCFIGAGASHTIHNGGNGAVIIGGAGNIISGTASFIGGGINSYVSGSHAVALGNYSRVSEGHNGAFVFTDSVTTPVFSKGADTMHLKFKSGVYITTDSGLYINGNPVLTGETPEGDTLQSVTTRGDTTTTSMSVQGQYLSGVSGVFESVDITGAATLTVSGNVGVGTDSPTSPTYSKHRVVSVVGTGDQAAILNARSSMNYTAQLIASKTVKEILISSSHTDSYVPIRFDQYDGTTFETPLYIDENQNVGIGTTTPTKLLDVDGHMVAERYYAGLYNYISSTSHHALINCGASSYGLAFYSAGGDFNINTQAGGGLGFSNGHGGNYNTPDIRLRRDNTGILGIRDNTNAQELRVYSDLGDPDGNYERGSFAMDTNGNLTIGTEAGGVGTTGDLLLQPSVGNVGIGTTSPTSFSASTKALHLVGTNAELKAETNNGGGWAFSHYKTPNSDWLVGADNDDKFRISSNGGNLADATLTIETGGNVGIRTTNPTQALTIDGSVNFAALDSSIIGYSATESIRFYNPTNEIILSAATAVRFSTDIRIAGDNAVENIDGDQYWQFYNQAYDGFARSLRFNVPIVVETSEQPILTSRTNLEFRIDSNNDSTSSKFFVTRDTGEATVDELFTIKEDGNVGIGTVSPAYTLDVNGDVGGTGVGNRITLNGTGYLLSGDSPAETQTLQDVTTNGDTTTTNIISEKIVSGATGFFDLIRSEGNLKLGPAGAYIAMYDNEGNSKKLYGANVGLGYQSNAVSAMHLYLGANIDNPDVKLMRESANVLGLRNSTAAQQFNIYNEYTSSTDYERAALKWDSDVFAIDTQTGSAGGAVRALDLRTSGQSALFIDAGTQKVGIGTTYPVTELQIDTPADNLIGQGVRINRPSAGTHYHALEFSTDGTCDWSVGQNAEDSFQVYENGASATTRFTIKEGGNVGIGTTNPSHLLNVKDGDIYAQNSNIHIHQGYYIKNASNGNQKVGFPSDAAFTFSNVGVGIGITDPTEDLEVSGNVTIGQNLGGGTPDAPWLTINGYDEHGIELHSHYGTTKWRVSTEVNGPLQLYNTGSNLTQQVDIGHTSATNGGNLFAWNSDGSVLGAGRHPTLPILDIGIQNSPASHRGDAYIDVRDDVNAPSRFHFIRGGEFITSGVSVSGSVAGTGIGGRITLNGTGYLLSGDSPAETQTLQDVTTNGNTTTTSIAVHGQYLSGVTGVFESVDITGAATLTVSGNVGIGTTPSARLHVKAGTSNWDGGLLLEDNTDGKASVISQEAGALNIGYAADATDPTSASSIMVLKNDGSVGIGTSAPITQLDVVGTGLFSEKVGIGLLDPDKELEVAGTIKMSTHSDALLFASPTTDKMAMGLYGGNDLLIKNAGGNTHMAILNAGQVGIGTNAPAEKLEIMSGCLSITSGLSSNIYLNSDTSNYGNHEIKFGFNASKSYPVALVGASQHGYCRGTLQVWVSPTLSDGASATVSDKVAEFHSGKVETYQRLNVVDDLIEMGVSQNAGTQAFKFSRSENKAAIYSVPQGSYGRADMRFTVGDEAVGTPRTEADATVRIAPQGGMAIGHLYAKDNSTDVSSGTLLVEEKVGIGTSAPDSPLEIDGRVAIRGANWLLFGQSTASYNSWTTRQYASTSTHKFNAQAFIFNDEGYGSSEFMRITNDGYVGIGLANPIHTLHVSGSVAGTGVGNRITLNGTGYLLSGDSPAETQTLQDVTTNGNTTTTSILSTGPHISGVTGLFSSRVGIGITDPARTLHIYEAATDTDVFVQADSAKSAVLYLGETNTAIYRPANTSDLRLYQGGADVLSIKGGKVGIGTTAPAQKLHAAGITRFSNASSNYIEIDGSRASDNNAVISNQFNQLILETNEGAGDPDICLLPASGGNVGIGNNSPAYPLSVSSAAYAVDNYIDVYVSNSKNAGILFRDPAGGRASITANTDNDLVFATNGTGSSSETMRILDDGKVGIGTDNPTAIFHVQGGGGSLLQIGDDTNPYGSALGYNVSATANTVLTMGWVGSALNRFLYLDGKTSTVGGGPVLLELEADTSQTADLFRITSANGTAGDLFVADADGNVGIGTTDPTELLHVSGGILLAEKNDAASTWHNIIVADNSASGVGTLAGIGFNAQGWTNDIAKAGIFQKREGSYGRGSLYFVNNNDSTWTSATEADAAITIDPDGRVGIGTTDPEVALHVSGDGIKLQSTATNANNAVIELGTAGANSSPVFSMGSAGAPTEFKIMDLGYWRMATTASKSLSLGTNTTDALFIDASQNVGIGTGRSPAASFDVDGTTRIRSNSNRNDWIQWQGIHSDGRMRLRDNNDNNIYQLQTSSNIQCFGEGKGSGSYGLADWAFMAYQGYATAAGLNIGSSNGTANTHKSLGISTHQCRASNMTSAPADDYINFDAYSVVGNAAAGVRPAMRFGASGFNFHADTDYNGFGDDPHFSINQEGYSYFTGSLGVGLANPVHTLHVSGSVAGTGVAGRITLNGTGYLLSGDSPAETQTLQDVTTNGDTTTTNIISEKIVSGVTGLFSESVGIGTDNPLRALHVAHGGIYVPVGDNGFGTFDTTAKVNILNDGATDSTSALRIFRQGGNETFRVYGGGKVVMGLISDSRVGIGTATPAAKLHIKDSTNPPEILFEDAAGGTQTAKIVYDQGGQNSLVLSTQYQSATDLNLIQFAPADNVAMTIRGGTSSEDGNVGIGLTNPVHTLHVSGSVAGTGVAGRITLNGTGYLLSGDSPAETQTLQDVTTNGNTTTTNIISEKIVSGVSGLFSSSVGIGKTAPAYPLDVDGIIQASTAGFYIASTEVLGYAGGVTRLSDLGGGLQFRTLGTTKMTILTGGNVGIGKSDPSYPLDVNGTIQGGTIYSNLFSVGNEGKVVSTSTAGLLLQATAGSKPITFYTNVGGNTERMRITPAGDVGIGVSDPSEMLELGAGGKIGFTDSAGTYDSAIYVDGSTFKVSAGSGSYHADKVNILDLLNLGAGHSIRGVDSSIIANKDILAPKSGSFGFRTYGATNQYDAISSIFIDNNNNALAINTKAGGTTSEAVRIDKDGNVGIGLTNPAHTLHVSGSVAGTGVAGRITLNGTGYLLSGDSPAETQTLQDVTTNGNSTTTSVFVEGQYLSGVTGLFSDELTVANGDITISDTSKKLRVGNTFYKNGAIEGNGNDIRIAAGGTKSLILHGGDELGIQIIDGGNVGIGITNPTSKLEVDGEVTFSGVVQSYAKFYESSSDYPTSATVFALTDYYNSAEWGMFVQNAGLLCIAQSGSLNRLQFDTNHITVTGYNLKFDSIQSTTSPAINLRGSEGGDEVGIYSPATNKFSIVTDRLDRVAVDAVGNVGVGTTTPAKRLSVAHDNGTALNPVAEFIGGGSVDDETQIHVGNAIVSTILGFNNGNGSLTGQYGYVGITGAGSTYKPIAFRSSNVGIGTTNPSTELHVEGDIRVGGATSLLDMDAGAKIVGQYYGNGEAELTFLKMYNSSDASINMGTKHALGYISFAAGNGAYTERMRINNVGYVGIGTTSPSAILEISSSAPKIRLTDTDGAWSEINGNGGHLSFTADGAGGLGGTRIDFDVDGSNKMRITTDGYVGIGTSSPSYELDVNGTTRSTYYIGGAYLEENVSSSKLKFYTDGTVLVMDENGSLKPCEKENDTLVFGVSKKDFDQPVVLGAEPVLVTGPIKIGDYIVTSSKQGHGQAMKEERLGTVIAQAMEKGDGGSHHIKAMVRKM